MLPRILVSRVTRSTLAWRGGTATAGDRAWATWALLKNDALLGAEPPMGSARVVLARTRPCRQYRRGRARPTQALATPLFHHDAHLHLGMDAAFDLIGACLVELKRGGLARILHAAVSRLVFWAGDQDIVLRGIVVDELDGVAALQRGGRHAEGLILLADRDLIGISRRRGNSREERGSENAGHHLNSSSGRTETTTGRARIMSRRPYQDVKTSRPAE